MNRSTASWSFDSVQYSTTRPVVPESHGVGHHHVRLIALTLGPDAREGHQILLTFQDVDRLDVEAVLGELVEPL